MKVYDTLLCQETEVSITRIVDDIVDDCSEGELESIRGKIEQQTKILCLIAEELGEGFTTRLIIEHGCRFSLSKE